MRTLLLLPALLVAPAAAQSQGEDAGFPGLAADRAPRVEIAWNRLYPYGDILAQLDQLAAEWPELFSMEVVGHSVEGREMRVYTLNNPATGPAETKPGMWVDGNVHGNEVQGSETIVYLAWYLLENFGSNERVDELLDGSAFYLMPSVNPDGRDHWFAAGNSASSSRSGVQPVDSDRDGAFDEDPTDDLDGDGSIVQMRKYMPGEGDYRLDPDDPRLLVRVPSDSPARGDWVLLGSEGIDNDGDGRLNEDGRGGYDMNRAWPSLWMPPHAQFGAGAYPLYWPETRSTARFLIEHTNVAGVQSFHNSGGMILRGPGAEAYGDYPRGDLRAYDALGKDGERMLPFYRYMVIWKDLYSVFGGFVTWTYEGLGIISFTNEMWSSDRSFPDPSSQRDEFDSFDEKRHWFNDHLLMGAGFVDWHAYDHPFYGEVEIGGFRKDVGRVPPTFLMEEELHRNAMFCIRHAEEMPAVTIEEPNVTELGNGVRAIDVVLRNPKEIPTRSEMAARKDIGRPDLIHLEGDGIEVLAGGYRSDRFRPERIDLQEHEPERLVRDRGISGRGQLRVRWLVRGGGSATVSFEGEKVRDVRRDFEIQ
ncbi:MAG: M14 family metallopeptidase [Planctomycetota bacterium]